MTADWKQLGADALTPWQEAIVELHERLSKVERLLDGGKWVEIERHGKDIIIEVPSLSHISVFLRNPSVPGTAP
jgi:hypothetical protein